MYPHTKKITVTINPPVNKAKWKVSGFAMGPTTVTASIIFAISQENLARLSFYFSVLISGTIFKTTCFIFSRQVKNIMADWENK
ncbi:MAG: hypothetical protein J7K32_06650, partial [Deltaproteobacteria bacterium]|nr:hypothetical protein [Deltaproteobacteria bacterium]